MKFLFGADISYRAMISTGQALATFLKLILFYGIYSGFSGVLLVLSDWMFCICVVMTVLSLSKVTLADAVIIFM